MQPASIVQKLVQLSARRFISATNQQKKQDWMSLSSGLGVEYQEQIMAPAVMRRRSQADRAALFGRSHTSSQVKMAPNRASRNQPPHCSTVHVSAA